jgi:hypothetical protein
MPSPAGRPTSAGGRGMPRGRGGNVGPRRLSLSGSRRPPMWESCGTRFARPDAMPHELTREKCLSALQTMLGHLIIEEQATRSASAERAAHLTDAIADLRILIARLEAEAPAPVFSDRRQYWPQPDAERRKHEPQRRRRPGSSRESGRLVDPLGS